MQVNEVGQGWGPRCFPNSVVDSKYGLSRGLLERDVLEP